MIFFLLQVNDFLSGAAPLNLTMRLGDHMMLIQLQLSTVNQASSSSSSSSRRRSSIQISTPTASNQKVVIHNLLYIFLFYIQVFFAKLYWNREHY